MVNLLWILFFFGVASGVELLIRKKLFINFLSDEASNLSGMNPAAKIKASFIKVLPEIVGLFLFFGVAYVSFFLFEKTGSPIVRLTFFALLIVISLNRAISLISQILLSPAVMHFRIFPIQCPTAKRIHKVIVLVFGYMVSVLMFAVVVRRIGTGKETGLALHLLSATILLVAIIFSVLIYRKQIRDYIISTVDDNDTKSWGLKQFASVWHILAIIYLGGLWLLLVKNIVSTQQATKGAFLLSIFAVPIWMVADKLVQWIVLYGVTTLKIHQEHYVDEEDVDEEIQQARKNGEHLYLRSRSIARTGLIFAFGVWIASLWNIKIPLLSNLVGVTIDALIILTLALMFWRFINSWIERKIEESIPEDEDENKEDDEWGGAATRGRSYTLLPMIRKFVATVLVIMVTMTILSSLGVDIGPLLAGAGVVGLAIGFGAQKLVADMFSGFFYLLDDAFRVGEYLTAGSVSGTVEAITLRNIMLRHHRGMLQIVPHSELGAITNYMRGGMIVKFNLDFPYDANIDKIRKIIKKVGIAMLEDETLGKDFIRPVKSQGVREISNSVMTIRVKFTAQPGTHFVIRREAFKRITEALKAAGIEYAHRKVIVDVPGLSEEGTNEQISQKQAQRKKIADTVGAAAITSVQQDENISVDAAKKTSQDNTV